MLKFTTINCTYYAIKVNIEPLKYLENYHYYIVCRVPTKISICILIFMSGHVMTVTRVTAYLYIPTFEDRVKKLTLLIFNNPTQKNSEYKYYLQYKFYLIALRS